VKVDLLNPIKALTKILAVSAALSMCPRPVGSRPLARALKRSLRENSLTVSLP